MNAACKDIADFLNDDTSLGLTLQTDLFYGRAPEKDAETIVTVMDNPGDPPMLTYDKATSNYYYSSVSVRVRSYDYDTGWSLMFDIMTYLHGLGQLNSIDGSAYYGLIRAMNDPQVLDWDDNDRVTFFINFEVQRKPI